MDAYGAVWHRRPRHASPSGRTGRHGPDGHVGAGAHDYAEQHGDARDHAGQRGTGRPGRADPTQPVAAAERGRRPKVAGGHLATLVAAQGAGRPGRTGATQPVAAAERGRRSKAAGGRVATLVAAQGAGGPGRADPTQPVAAAERGRRSKAAGGHSPDGHVGAGAHDCPHEHGGTRDHAEQRGTGQPRHAGAAQPVAAAERGHRPKVAGPLKNGPAGHHSPT